MSLLLKKKKYSFIPSFIRVLLDLGNRDLVSSSFFFGDMIAILQGEHAKQVHEMTGKEE